MADKHTLTCYVDDDTYEKMQQSMQLTNKKSASGFLNEALKFYIGYLNQQDINEYLLPLVATIVKKQLVISEKNISEHLFNLAVEISMISNLLSVKLNVDMDDMDRLRTTCQHLVSNNNGVIKFEDAYRFQNGDY